MTTSKKKIYFIVGPTASGKTALSIDLSTQLRQGYTGQEKTNTEIISADSRQIYKDLDLSTGKVTKEEMQGIPHHLLDVVEPGQYFSVVDFEKMALEKIEEIYSRGNIPIICGGTGFYIDTLLYEYKLPDAKKNDDLRKELETKKAEELFKILAQKLFAFKNWNYYFNNLKTYRKFSDPEFGKNKHRLMRAIEIVEELGYIPELVKTERFNNSEYEVKILSTNIPRDVLREKIYKRIIERLDAGMIEEIVKVKEKNNLSFEYLEKLGLEFKWIAKYLKQEITKEEMIEKLNLEIGQYAKRQDSWFRRYQNYR